MLNLLELSKFKCALLDDAAFFNNSIEAKLLLQNAVEESQMARMALGIATGLAHLHMEIIGTHGK